MTRRTRIIGAQAVAVALLAVLVYVTLLRPEPAGPLRGIQGPGNGERVEHPQGGEPDEQGGGGEQGPAGGGTSTAGGPTDTAGAPRAGRGAVLVENTPTKDQYDDAATALIRKVGSPVDGQR